MIIGKPPWLNLIEGLLESTPREHNKKEYDNSINTQELMDKYNSASEAITKFDESVAHDEYIHQKIQNLIDKYNLHNIDIEYMADLIETDSQQAANEFKTAYEHSSEFQDLLNKKKDLESKLQYIEQLSRVLQA